MRKIFVSYAHDSEEHRRQVGDLVDALRVRLSPTEFQVVLDRDELPGGPPTGWDMWSERQVVEAELVLVICTPKYRQSYDGMNPPGIGLGAACEARAIRQALYATSGHNVKFRAVALEPAYGASVPDQLGSYHVFFWDRTEAQAELLAWLQAPLGGVSSSPAAGRATISWPADVNGFVHQLADRDEPFGHFTAMMTGRTARRVLLLRGASNQGKTALVTEFVQLARCLGVDQVRVDLKGCPSLEEVLSPLEMELGVSVPSDAGARRGGLLMQALRQRSRPLLVAYDTYEQVGDDTRRWIEGQLLLQVDKCPAVLVVIGGQSVPDAGKHGWAPWALTWDLGPIADPACWHDWNQKKWKSAGLLREHIEAITLAAEGDPGMSARLFKSLVSGLAARPTGRTTT